MPLRIEETTAAPTIALFRLSGRLTVGIESASLEEAFTRTLAAGFSKLILDMKDLSYLDSAGLGTVVHGLTKMRKAGGEMRLVALDERVLKILRIAKMDQIIPIDASVEEACGKLGA